MKKFSLLFSLLLSVIFAFGQNNYIIKKNPGTGLLEVFKSGTGGNSNTPNGAPLMRLKKDPSTGYTIIENLDKKVEIETKINPYNQMPDYSILQYEPYKIDYTTLLESINVSNNLREVQLSVNKEKVDETETCDFFTSISKVAEKYLTIWNKNNINVKFKEGWYGAYSISNQMEIENCSAVYNVIYYLVKVKDNKIIESYISNHNDFISQDSKIFTKVNLSSSSEIQNLKATTLDINGNLSELYFINNIIDNNFQLKAPHFSTITFEGATRLHNITFDRTKTIERFSMNDAEYSCNGNSTIYITDFDNTYNIFVVKFGGTENWRFNNFKAIDNERKTFTLN